MTTLNTESVLVVIPCRNLTDEMNFFVGFGFKLQQVLPADNPQMMVMSAHGISLKLTLMDADSLVELRLCEGTQLQGLPAQSPNGTWLKQLSYPKPSYQVPESIKFSINAFCEAKSWITGRAGMLYRDLVDDRLNGAMIASNIWIPKGGPVADQVHFHDIKFQLIFCVNGWVKVVYEDQGSPFVLSAGDCVTQPPGIRHQVLESSDELEVIEIGLPAEHMTTIDHALNLPTDKHLPNRQFKGQTFCHHQHEDADWQKWLSPAVSVCETAVVKHSNGIAAVNVIKGLQPCDELITLKHKDHVRFYYLVQGVVEISHSNNQNSQLKARDSWVIPADTAIQLSAISHDFQCIEFVLINSAHQR